MHHDERPEVIVEESVLVERKQLFQWLSLGKVKETKGLPDCVETSVWHAKEMDFLVDNVMFAFEEFVPEMHLH